MFTVLPNGSQPPAVGKSQVYLVVDNWNDWFQFQTQFHVWVFAPGGGRHFLGNVKIGCAGLKGGPAETTPPHMRRPEISGTFQQLNPEVCFSLGQSEDYYATLTTLPLEFRVAVLEGLCDCAYDLSIFERHKGEASMVTSILREVSEQNLRHRFHRLAHGNAALTRFQFEYTLPVALSPFDIEPPVPPKMSFLVEPNSQPPSNVHVLIGRNGAGKTRCMQSLVNAVLSQGDRPTPPGRLELTGLHQLEWTFAGLVSVSFSAFDDSELPTNPGQLNIRTGFVGLRERVNLDGQEQDVLKTKQQLARDFVDSFSICREEPRRTRWLRAIRTLSSDPLFEQYQVERLLEVDQPDWKTSLEKVFGNLSSGHAIVLLTITRLVELVDEKTLVLLDEPEGHLHPPLLSAFIRAISNLLVSRNGLALIATHSPVVLQEVPSSRVWILSRDKLVSKVERPPTETFGESAGVLTREVFGLEVTKSGFHEMVASVVREGGRTFEQIEQHFGYKLGSEAKALVRSLLAQRHD